MKHHASSSAGGPTTKKYYEYVAHQIEREDGLINTRINWMLTFEGILFASLAFVADKEKVRAEVCIALKYVLPMLGILVGLLALLAVNGAVSALQELKGLWTIEKFPIHYHLYPRPYGAHWNHNCGVYYSQGLPLSIITAWICILVVLLSK